MNADEITRVLAVCFLLSVVLLSRPFFNSNNNFDKPYTVPSKSNHPKYLRMPNTEPDHIPDVLDPKMKFDAQPIIQELRKQNFEANGLNNLKRTSPKATSKTDQKHDVATTAKKIDEKKLLLQTRRVVRRISSGGGDNVVTDNTVLDVTDSDHTSKNKSNVKKTQESWLRNAHRKKIELMKKRREDKMYYTRITCSTSSLPSDSTVAKSSLISESLDSSSSNDDRSVWLRNACHDGYVLIDNKDSLIAKHHRSVDPFSDEVEIRKEYCSEERRLRDKRHSSATSNDPIEDYIVVHDERFPHHRVQDSTRNEDYKIKTRLLHPHSKRYICFDRRGVVKIMNRAEADASGPLCLFNELLVNATSSPSDRSPWPVPTRKSSPHQKVFIQFQSSFNTHWNLAFHDHESTESDVGFLRAINSHHVMKMQPDDSRKFHARDKRDNSRSNPKEDVSESLECIRLFSSGKFGKTSRHSMGGLYKARRKHITTLKHHSIKGSVMKNEAAAVYKFKIPNRIASHKDKKSI